jgi:hypothetical protein
MRRDVAGPVPFEPETRGTLTFRTIEEGEILVVARGQVEAVAVDRVAALTGPCRRAHHRRPGRAK